jgi:hypothetical protein
MKVRVNCREVRVERNKEGYILDLPAGMKSPDDLMDQSYFTVDGGHSFVEVRQVMQMTAIGSGSVLTEGGMTPTDPVKDKTLIEFLRKALHNSGVYSYTVLGVHDPGGLTHVWTFGVDPQPGHILTYEETGDTYRVLRKKASSDSKPQTIPESQLFVEFLGKSIKATDAVIST